MKKIAYFFSLLFFIQPTIKLLPQTAVTAGFTAPDTVCINAQVTFKNTSQGGSNYYWSFCAADFSSTPEAVNLGNPNGLLNTPVFGSYNLDPNGNYYGLMVNHITGDLIRLNFANSLLNTPTAQNLGEFNGVIPAQAEAIQVFNINGNWTAIIVGGGNQFVNSSPRIVKLDFGNSLANTPSATNWGNIGGLNLPHDLYITQISGNYYGFTINVTDNTITRFSFGPDFTNPPTGVNLGNIGNLDYPAGFTFIQYNGNWFAFIANRLSNSLTRLSFGTSLLNTPIGTDIANPGNFLNYPRDISLFTVCDGIYGFVVNEQSNEIVQLNFGFDLASNPTATDLGNLGNLDFPHSISDFFRSMNDIYAFIPNVFNNSITRIRFAGCQNIPGSSLQNPPAISYPQPGTYNINLLVDLGLPTQTSFCKQILVSKGPQGYLTGTTICTGDSAIVLFNSTYGTAPFSIEYSGNGSTYKLTGLKNSSTFVLPSLLTDTTFFTLKSITDANGCSANIDTGTTVNVDSPPKATITGGTLCAGDSAVVLFTATSGSSPFKIGYSSNANSYALIGLSNNSTFTIPYLLTDTTTLTLTSVTDANGCNAKPNTVSFVNVDPMPQGGISGGTACMGDSAGITFIASIGVGPYELKISDGVNTAVYHDIQSGVPFRIAPLTSTTSLSLLSISDHGGKGCARTNGFASPFASIAVIPSPVVQFDPLTPICIQQSSFLITQAKEITGIAGNGNFSGQGVDARGNFTPADAGVGAHRITYTYNANNGCSSSESNLVIVNPTPAVSAGPDILTCLGFPVQLNATGGSSYLWSPINGLDNPGIANPVATADSTATYIVLGTDSNGCFSSDTVTVNVGKNGIAAFVVPNAFTPNGDGHNDCFGIGRWGPVTIVEFSIFNRWGQVVFSTKNPSDCWDGTYHGRLQDTGGYPYIIKVKSPCGDITRKGIVMLVR